MHQQSHAARNKGFVLATSVIILLLITLVTLFAARTVMKEQQVTANQYRSDQALSAANAALDYALAYFDMGGIDHDGDYEVDELFGADLLDTEGILEIKDNNGDLTVYAKAFYCDIYSDAALGNSSDSNFSSDPANCIERPDIPDLTDPVNPTGNVDYALGIVAIGWSDDKSAQHIITVRAADLGLLGSGEDGPDWPLIARDSTNATGSVSVINRFTHKTIWTGGGAGVSGAGETFVARPDYTGDWFYEMRINPEPIQQGADVYTMGSTRKGSNINSDIIEGDPSLRSIVDGDVFFENFLRGNKGTLEGLADTIGQRYDTSDKTLWDTMYEDDVKGIVWIDTLGSTWNPDIKQGKTLGTPEDPVIMIINGNLNTTGAPGELNLVGLLYVTGDWDAVGNITIQGMIIVEGLIVAGLGGPTIVFDPTLFQPGLGSTLVGATGMIPGSWKDWRN